MAEEQPGGRSVSQRPLSPQMGAAKLLLPFWKPASNAPEYSATIEVLACTADRDWLSHATGSFQSIGQRKIGPEAQTAMMLLGNTTFRVIRIS